MRRNLVWLGAVLLMLGGSSPVSYTRELWMRG